MIGDRDRQPGCQQDASNTGDGGTSAGTQHSACQKQAYTASDCFIASSIYPCITRNQAWTLTMILIAKTITLLCWLAILVNWAHPFSEPTHTYLHWLGIVLLVAHALEAVLYRPLIKQIEGNPLNHYLQVLLFGGAHYMKIKGMKIKGMKPNDVTASDVTEKN
jgi:uncharacterized protein YhhL (DUF1145 family)